jgi:hypothetical protein
MPARSNKKLSGLAGFAAGVVRSVKDVLTGAGPSDDSARADFVPEPPAAANGAARRAGRKAPATAPANKLKGKQRSEMAAEARRKRAPRPTARPASPADAATGPRAAPPPPDTADAG